jgi:hypothetical protein
MFMCHVGLEDGSPPVASCSVEIPDSERATSDGVKRVESIEAGELVETA